MVRFRVSKFGQPGQFLFLGLFYVLKNTFEKISKCLRDLVVTYLKGRSLFRLILCGLVVKTVLKTLLFIDLSWS